MNKKNIVLLFFCSLILAVLTLLPYSVNISHGVPNVIDPLFYAWNLSHNADTMLKGMDAALNTNIFYPLTNTIAYSDTLWGQSIITNPIIWITHNPVLTENIAVILSFPLSAIFMYLLAIYLTGNSFASFAAGIFYAFSYPRLSQIGHLPMISSEWIPLYILYLLKFLDIGKRKYFILLCIWYVLSTASSIYFSVFLLPITALVIIVDAVKRIRNHTIFDYKNRLIATLPVIIPFLVVLGIVLFPYIRLKVEYPQIKRSIDDVTDLRATLADYISVLPTSIIASKFFPKHINEHVLYPTLTVILLSLIGIAQSVKRNRYIIVSLLLIVASSFILSLGNEQSFSIGSFSTGTIKLPYYYLYNLFPVFQIVRVPARFSIFIVLSLSVLAALGVDNVMKKIKSKWAVGLLILPFLIEIWQVQTPFVSVPLENSVPKVYTWIRVQPEPMILAEVPISLFYHGKLMEDQLYIPYAALQQSDTYALETYRTYFSAFHKKRMLNGYSGFLPDQYNRMAEALENFPSEYSIAALQDIGITHAVVHIWQYYDAGRRVSIMNALTTSPLLTLTYSDDKDFVYKINKK